MLIVISHPEPLINEANRINALFRHGMKRFHLRKPGMTEHDMYTLLDQIDPAYYNHIAIHQHHVLSKKFPIKRLHFTEAMRALLTKKDYQTMESEALTYSTSIHHAEEYAALNPVFNYTFYGPLFESISKPGYKPKAAVLEMPVKQSSIPLIALGGISTQTITQVKELGYDGAAVLGSVWHAANELQEFLTLNESWKLSDLTY